MSEEMADQALSAQRETMSNEFDLNLISLTSSIDEQTAYIPGLHVAAKPRRAARGRHEDQLILYLCLEGNAPMAPERMEQLLARLSQTYYKTAGSVTAALKHVAEVLNQFLLERNRRGSSDGRQVLGILTQFVLRGGRIYLAQSGPAHAFLISATQVHHYHDAQIAGRGLGISKMIPVRYYQAELQPKDTLLLSHTTPSNWTAENLKSLYGQGPEGYRRHLAGDEQAGILIQVKSGSGKILVHHPRPISQPSASTPEEPSLEQPPSSKETPAEGESTETVIPLPAPASQTPIDTSPPTLSQGQVESTPQPGQNVASPTSTPAEARQPAPPISKPDARRRSRSASFAGSVLKVLQIITDSFNQVAKATGEMLNRILPGDAQTGLPPSMMAFFAVAIPIIVVTAASVIYFNSGRAGQYQSFYLQAQQAASQAESITDPEVQRAAWGNVLAYLDEAESYEKTDDSAALRNLATQKLNNLNGIIPLNYLRALSLALPEDVSITRMAATNDELFLLNSNTGSILRYTLAANTYERDDNFQCGPGTPGSLATGVLIDFSIVPKGSQLNATLLAMDADGNVLSCVAGENPEPDSFTPPPTGFGKLNGLAVDSGNVYVLDPQKNAVWAYWRSKFNVEPELFFSEDIPPMQSVIDLAVSGDDLYLLHEDGHLTICSYSPSDINPTRCKEPAIFIDSRPGRENFIFIPEAPFSQIITTQPPDPSLFLFEPTGHGVYHFSLRILTFHRQYKPDNIQGFVSVLGYDPATAFTISSDNRLIFLASGNQVFYANMP
jgi:hypothetical protein